MKQFKSYSEARNSINDGDIVFIRNRQTLVSAVIRFFIRSKYSHAGFAFWAIIGEQKRLMIAEAQGGAHRRILNMSFYQADELDIIQAPKPWTSIVESALTKLGQVEYGWIEAYYVGIREFLLKYLNIKIPAINLPGEICSEYIADNLGLEERHISPQLLWENLLKIGHKHIIKVRRK